MAPVAQNETVTPLLRSWLGRRSLGLDDEFEGFER
jgi:hypothetical protein